MSRIKQGNGEFNYKREAVTMKDITSDEAKSCLMKNSTGKWNEFMAVIGVWKFYCHQKRQWQQSSWRGCL